MFEHVEQHLSTFFRCPRLTVDTMASRNSRATRKLRFGVNSVLEELGRVKDNGFCSSNEEPVREADNDEEEETDFEEYVHIVT